MLKYAFTATFFLSLFAGNVIAQNVPPVITNVSCLADTVDDRLIVYYDVADNENDDVDVIFRVSDNAGYTYIYNTANAVGDVGYPTTPGQGKILVWDYSGVADITQFKVKLVADDRVPISIQDIVDQVDSTRIMNDLQYIAQPRHHQTSNAHWIGVRDSIYSRFESYNLQCKRDTFTYQNINGENEVGRLAGCKDEHVVYIMDAHFDGVANSPGADDNGAGMAGVLEGARILSQYNYERSMNFIGFDLEELGTVGSARYVNDGGMEPWENVQGVINFEMIGFYSDKDNTQQFPPGLDQLFPAAYDSVVAHNWKGNFITNVGNVNSQPLIDTYDSCAAAFVPDLRVISLAAPGTGFLTPDLRRSDHSRFWDKQIMALMISNSAEYRNANYHTPDDIIDSLNVEFIWNNVKAAVGTMAHLARPQHSTVSYHDIQVHPESGIADAGVAPFSFLINPNPNSGQFQLQLNGTFPSTMDVRIVDIQGRIVYDEQVSTPAGQPIEISDLNLNSGFYHVLLSTPEHTALRKLVITY